MSTHQDQLGFFSGYDIRQATSTRLAELDKAFRQFHEDHPEIWRLFVRFSFDLIRGGRAHYSARAVIHRIRWHTDVDTGAGEEFKVNNNLTPSYSRLFHETYPEHAGFFRTRRQISKDAPARGRQS